MSGFVNLVNRTRDGIKSRIQNIATDTEPPSPYPPVMTADSMNTKVVYNGIVLTSIDVKASPTDENPNRVTFSDKNNGSTDDDDAVFLCDIKEIAREGEGYNTLVDFEATSLTPSEAVAMIEGQKDESGQPKKALFCIHGFNTGASFHLADCLFAKPKFTKVQLIPVIWPSEGRRGSYSKYREERSYSHAAGKALQSMKGPLNSLNCGASIVCHSTGNRIFRSFSDAEIDFDNIFMVAADIDNDIFHQGYIDGGDQEWRQHGLNIKEMLRDETKGKIHVIYNESDVKLIQSSVMNLGPRLGAGGVNFQKKFMRDVVHEDLAACIVNVNASIDEGEVHKKMLYDKTSDHNYHFHINTIKYYDDNA